jgi:hypothetical protein
VGLRVQADALFKRIGQTGDRNFGGANPIERRVRRERANSWEFPLTVNYGRDFARVRPFASGGASVRWINSREGSEETFLLIPTTQPPQPPFRLGEYRVDDAIAELGWVAGGGVRFDWRALRIAPEIRYTRWKSERFLPTRNQVEFLLGIMF